MAVGGALQGKHVVQSSAQHGESVQKGKGDVMAGSGLSSYLCITSVIAPRVRGVRPARCSPGSSAASSPSPLLSIAGRDGFALCLLQVFCLGDGKSLCERCGFLQVKVMRPEVRRSGAAICFPPAAVCGQQVCALPSPGFRRSASPWPDALCSLLGCRSLCHFLGGLLGSSELLSVFQSHRIPGSAVAKGSGAVPVPAGPAAICVQCGGSHWNPQLSCSGRTAVSTAGKEPGASVGSGVIWHKAPLIYSAANVLEERSDRCEHPADLCSCCRMPPCPLGAAACSAGWWPRSAAAAGTDLCGI